MRKDKKGFQDINQHFLKLEEQMIKEKLELNDKNINKNVRKVGK